ncbi:MAG: tRNA threonylcarbamoyladenosine dehydratase [Planctomycetota bacterium]
MKTQEGSSGSDIPIWLSRLGILVGNEAVAKLQRSRVAVVGLGGVGSWAAEALARSGVGRIMAVDGDIVSESDLNRQLFSTAQELGNPKAVAARRRIESSFPETRVKAVTEFFTAANSAFLFDFGPDVVVDAIDRFNDKVELLTSCIEKGVPVVSSMGAGGRTDPTRVRTADIGETSGCPLARKVRSELRKRGISSGITAVFSTEPHRPAATNDDSERAVQGSCVWVTAVFGFCLAGVAAAILTK